MEKRRLAREHKKLLTQHTLIDVPMQDVAQAHSQAQSKSKKNATLARRARKEKQRARMGAARGDEMEIG
jgi:hypothetical protein